MKRQIFLSILVFPLWIYGMTVNPSVVQEQLDAAPLVAQIKVLKKWAHPDPIYHARWTAEVKVQRILEIRDDGRPFPSEGENILLHGIGGEHGELGVILSGFPRPFVGKQYKSYLARDGNDFQVAGFEFGLIPQGSYRAFSRNRTDGSDGAGSGPFLEWQRDFFPISYFISADTFSNLSTYLPAIVDSFDTWKAVSNTVVDFIGLGCSSTSENQNDGVNNVIFEDSNWVFDSSVIAITRNFFISGNSPKSGQILDSDIIFNGVDHQFTVTGEAGRFDVQNIMTHEIGHLLGMGHEVAPIDTDATMYAIAAANETKKRDLAANDIAGVRDAYSGVVDKLANSNISCDVSTTAACNAVRHPCKPGSPASLLWLVLSVMTILVAGRVSFYFR